MASNVRFAAIASGGNPLRPAHREIRILRPISAIAGSVLFLIRRDRLSRMPLA